MKTQTNQQSTEKIILPLLEPIKNATYRGSWEGYDGAFQYVNSDRLKLLQQKFGDEAYNWGLKVCLHTIISSTLEKKNYNVLSSFVEHYPEVIIKLAKTQPDFFKDSEIQNLCFRALGNANQKSFIRYMKKYQEKASNENAEQFLQKK